LRERLIRDASLDGITVFIPSIRLCGDNAAMIAATGYHYLMAGIRTKLDADVFSRSR
jgi:N6-L-threonylcarbamoyladenine synthase